MWISIARVNCPVKSAFVLLLCVTSLEIVLTEDEDASHFTKAFDVWMRFEKGYDSITVEPGQTIPIRCRVSVNGTEWTSEQDLRKVSISFFKDGKALPDYWRSARLAEKDRIVVHSKASWDILDAQESNRGLYKCQGYYKGARESLEFNVRVREDKPQWPAIAIGIEIVILAIIFFFYERKMRRPEPEVVEDDESEGEDEPMNGKK